MSDGHREYVDFTEEIDFMNTDEILVDELRRKKQIEEEKKRIEEAKKNKLGRS